MKRLVLGIEYLVVDIAGMRAVQELVAGMMVAGMMPVAGILDLVEMVQLVANIFSNFQHCYYLLQYCSDKLKFIRIN